jgi:hypothetical protein
MIKQQNEKKEKFEEMLQKANEREEKIKIDKYEKIMHAQRSL